MLDSTPWLLRLLGISGILGAIMMVAGDLLYNHVPGSAKSPAEKMSFLPQSRLLNAGTLGVLGCWLYALASAHILITFLPVGRIFGSLVFLAFGAVMICYGIAHTAYFAIASGARVAVQLGSDAETGGNLGNTFFSRLVRITYIPVIAASILMAYGILGGHSLYPRWMVLFLPVVVYMLKTPVVRLLRGRLREIVNDAYDNIALLVFFSLSTLILWNRLTP